jgi:sugar/nucleoside kinase (ribokinase family)
LNSIPVVNQIFNNQDVVIWSLIPVIAFVVYLLHRTQFGLRLKATGEAPMAARAAGVRVQGVRFLSILISGVFSGIGGADLAIGSVHLFSENMTDGRGTIAFAAVIFAGGLVPGVVIACLLFGFAQALAALVQIQTSFPSQFVLMAPYVLTVLAIWLADVARKSRFSFAGFRRVRKRAIVEDKVPIAVIGHLSIDDIQFADGRELQGTIGGAAGYASLGVFLAGGHAELVSIVGEDYPIERLRLTHPDGGLIDFSGVTMIPGDSIHHTAHYQADGERSWEIADYSATVRQTPGPDDVRGVALNGQWALIQPAPFDQQEALIAVLRKAGARIALDTESHYFPADDALDTVKRVASQVDCFLPSREHLREIFGERADDLFNLPELAGQLGCDLVVVKCGAEGVVVVDGIAGTVQHVPAVADRIVTDPTGAGDAFNGGFLVAMAAGSTPTDAAANGCVSASFAIESIGMDVPASFSGSERERRKRKVLASFPAQMREANSQRKVNQ